MCGHGRYPSPGSLRDSDLSLSRRRRLRVNGRGGSNERKRMGNAHADVRRVRLAKGQPPRWPTSRESTRKLRLLAAALQSTGTPGRDNDVRMTKDVFTLSTLGAGVSALVKNR